MKTYGGVQVSIYVFVTSALDGGEWWGSGSGQFTPGEKAPGTHFIGGWVSLRVALDAVAKRKSPCLFWESNPGRPSRNWLSYPVLHEELRILMALCTLQGHVTSISLLVKWLDTDWMTGLRFPIVVGISLRHRVQSGLWGPTGLLSSGYRRYTGRKVKPTT